MASTTLTQTAQAVTDTRAAEMARALDDMPPMVRSGSFAAATGIGERTLRRALNAGTMPGVRLGKGWFVNVAAARELLGI